MLSQTPRMLQLTTNYHIQSRRYDAPNGPTIGPSTAQLRSVAVAGCAKQSVIEIISAITEAAAIEWGVLETVVTVGREMCVKTCMEIDVEKYMKTYVEEDIHEAVHGNGCE